MTKSELEQQLLQLSPNDKLYIIQFLAQSLTTPKTSIAQPITPLEFFRQSPLAECAEELDLNRDRSLARDNFNL